MTIDDLAVLIQGEFHVMRGELASKDDLLEAKRELGGRITSLEERALILDGRMVSLEKGMASSERNFLSLEEKMENGFSAVIAEIQDIRRVLKLVDRREQVDALDVRVGIVEQKIGMG